MTAAKERSQLSHCKYPRLFLDRWTDGSCFRSAGGSGAAAGAALAHFPAAFRCSVMVGDGAFKNSMSNRRRSCVKYLSVLRIRSGFSRDADPDPAFYLNADPGIRLINSVANPDPVPCCPLNPISGMG